MINGTRCCSISGANEILGLLLGGGYRYCGGDTENMYWRLMMNRRLTYALATLLAVGMIATTGCQKKPPKGSQQVQTEQPMTQQGGQAAPVDKDGTITVGPLTATLPNGWESVAPSAPMRKAELKIPSMDKNGVPGFITVFYFGPQAGSIDMNIERWVGQFEQANGQPLSDDMVKREHFKANDLDVTMVSFSGTQRASQMPGSPQMHAIPGFMNVSGIVITPEGPWFFKGVGPEMLMTANKGMFKSFLTSMSYHAEAASNPHSGS